MKTIIALFMVAMACSAMELQAKQNPNDDKVYIELYYESLCPYCQQFILGSLKTAANTKDLWLISDFRAIPYGNARTTQNGTSWSFTCQHGVNECVGNMIEACAINMYDWYTKALPFIICIEANPNNWSASGQKCSTELGLNWTDINACANGPKGIQYLYEMGKKTQALNPPHQYVPWVVANGGHSSKDESAIESNMVQWICANYKGTTKIAACGK